MIDGSICVMCGKEAINESGACKKCWSLFANVYNEEI